jgi:hypothetical protein
MSLPTTDASFAQVRAVAQTYIEYPFIEIGDNTTKVYHMICQQNRDDYDASQVALDTTMASAANAGVIKLPFAADATAYFVGDFGHSPIDGGLVEFERVFANIPQTLNGVFTGTQSYTYPGYQTTLSQSGTDRTITGITTSSGISTVTCTNSVSVGDVVYIVATWTGAITKTFTGYRVALTGTTGSAVKVADLQGGTTFDNGTLTELDYQPRGQKSQLTGSITDYSYYLPGVTGGITDPTDVTEDDVFQITNTTTLEASQFVSETTLPDLATYDASVTAGDYIIVSSEVNRWKGNILVKENRKIRAL